jgi:hypothetical protein
MHEASSSHGGWAPFLGKWADEPQHEGADGMSRHIFTRPATVEELPQIIDWELANSHRNDFDPDVLTYPKTEVMAAVKDGEPVGYLPVQIAMCESFAPRPGISEAETALQFKAFLQALYYLAAKNGIREIFVPTSEPGTQAMLEKHGFTKSQCEMYVMRVK